MATIAINTPPAYETTVNAIITIVWYSKATILNKVAAMSNTFKIVITKKTGRIFYTFSYLYPPRIILGIILSQSFFSNTILTLLHEY